MCPATILFIVMLKTPYFPKGDFIFMVFFAWVAYKYRSNLTGVVKLERENKSE